VARIKAWLASFRREDGQAAVEYGVLLALILVVSIVVIGLLGGEVQAAFQSVVDALPGGGGGGS
jgi:pilus assembly protein Flp/PilA